MLWPAQHTTQQQQRESAVIRLRWFSRYIKGTRGRLERAFAICGVSAGVEGRCGADGISFAELFLVDRQLELELLALAGGN